MATLNRLTAVAVENARGKATPYKLFDGGGLFLLVRPDGGRWWRLKYRYAGAEKLLSLGTYPQRSLAQARKARDLARQQLADGQDPSQLRREAKRERDVARVRTFEAVAREWFSKRAAGEATDDARPQGRKARTGIWAPTHSEKVLSRLENHVFPAIRTAPLDSIKARQLAEVLQSIEAASTPDTAHRCRQYVNAVFRYAVAAGLVDSNPTPPAEVLTPVVTSRFAAITDPKGVRALVRSIQAYPGSPTTRAALSLAPLLFVRPGELRNAQWDEIDLEHAEWRIPAERMKTRRAHTVPLSRQAVQILSEQHRLTGSERAPGVPRYVFPSERSVLRPMSENTLNVALRSLGYSKSQMTAHGFRHMASTLLHESRKWRSEVIERQLAHVDRNAIRAI